MTRPLLLLLAVLAASAASAQHDHARLGGSADHGAEVEGVGVTETFVVTGLRIDEAEPPPGSGVGRAGVRFADGGYISVVHGKPYARSRMIWGGLVAWDAVWAAGAHRATELVTTVPLRIGETTIGPGAVSLFVTPRADAPWTLHVNRSLGAHLADEYDPADDLATVHAAPVRLADAVEGLTWSFAPDGTALVLSWGDRAISFPMARSGP